MRTSTPRHGLLSRAALLAPALAGLLVVCVVSCTSIHEMAPPVDGAIVEAGEANGASSASLERGRRLYLGTCIDCHGPEPVDRYSEQQWTSIIRRMAPLSKLDASETRDLEAYVQSVLRARVMGAPTGAGSAAGRSG